MTTAESVITFPDAHGTARQALLRLPDGRPPRAFALFAHCFPHDEAGAPASLITEALAGAEIGVLRFGCSGRSVAEDVTGDLLSAAAYLRDSYRPATVLLGHSAGGSAVLAASHRIPEIRAVVTIGAPAPTEPDRVGRLGTAVLILHSPEDENVPVEEARKIYLAARHPKSFIAIDKADHLLSRASDAGYAAAMIGPWVDRYAVDPAAAQSRQPNAADTPAEGIVGVHETGRSQYEQRIRVGRHVFTADEPKPVGQDAGPSPYDLLLAGLGACTSMTMRMYAQRKGWPMERATVELRHSRIHAEDCENCETEEGKVDRIERMIRLDGPLDADQRRRLLEIADKCPVHRTLHSEIAIITTDGSPGTSADRVN